jgi:predicted alpha/beta-hydrolase family hydrolase
LSEPTLRTPFYAVIRERAIGIPDRTVYRPVGGSEPRGTFPIVVWANGGCRHSNVFFATALTLLAAQGYVVVADGAPETPSTSETEPTALPHRIRDVLDWINESEDARTQLSDASPDHIAVMGQSCGGIEALVAGADPRVGTVVSLNSGFAPTTTLGYERELLDDLHTPVLFVHGGPQAVEYFNSLGNYSLVNVPAAVIEATDAGHSGIFHGVRDGHQDGTLGVTEDLIRILAEWLSYCFGRSLSAREFLTGPAGVAALPGWTIEHKDL